MRIIIIAFILVFSLQSWTKADDISEFEMEGISIGDSLLDYFKEEEIKENKQISQYPNDEYILYNFSDVMTLKLMTYLWYQLKKMIRNT